jgi:antitoxin (DNA-binding transcriptional repressor) of toxin-antitoxin stability system
MSVTRQYKRIDVDSVEDFERLVDEVSSTGTSHIITRDGEEVAMVMPFQRKRTNRPRSKRRTGVLRPDDTLLNIIGMFEGSDPDGATDVSRNKKKYLGEAYLPKRR